MRYKKPILENSYLFINNINNTTQQSIVQSEIKNNQKFSYNIPHIPSAKPKEIHLRDIYNQMLNLLNYCYDNENDNFYVKLNEDELFRRKIIVESIKCFIVENKVRYKIFYYIIFLLDLLIAKNKKKKLIATMEKLGIGSSILMIKFLFEENRMITMKKYKTIFKNKYYSSKEIREIEVLCLKLLNYNLTFPSPISFFEIIILNRSIFCMDDIKRETRHQIYNVIIDIMEKIFCESNKYIKYNPLHLCCCILYYSREKVGLEKWPRILTKLFNTNYKSFEMIYNEYFKIYKYKKINKNNFDSSNNNSTNIDSHRNYSNSNGKDKINIKNEDDFKNNLCHNIYSNYKERHDNNYKIGIKKINLNISQDKINHVISSEIKKRRYYSCLDINEKREKSQNDFLKDLSSDKSFIYRNKSNLESVYNNLRKLSSKLNEDKILSFNYIEKFIDDNTINKNNKNFNYINSLKEDQNKDKNKIILKKSIEKEKEPIKNIKVTLKPFTRRQSYIPISNNLDKYINTESNNNTIIQKIIKFDDSKYKKFTPKKENLVNKNEEYIHSSSKKDNINNDVKKSNNKRYSSCDTQIEEKNNDKDKSILSNEGKPKNFSIRRNYCYLKKLKEKMSDKENDESLAKKSIIKNINSKNYNIRRRNINKIFSSRSIESLQNKNVLPPNNSNYKKYNNINPIIFEKDKNDNNDKANNEQLDSHFKNSKKSSNIRHYRYSSLENFYGYKKDKTENLGQNINEFRKIPNIRNFYKQKNARMNKCGNNF